MWKKKSTGSHEHSGKRMSPAALRPLTAWAGWEQVAGPIAAGLYKGSSQRNVPWELRQPYSKALRKPCGRGKKNHLLGILVIRQRRGRQRHQLKDFVFLFFRVLVCCFLGRFLVWVLFPHISETNGWVKRIFFSSWYQSSDEYFLR